MNCIWFTSSFFHSFVDSIELLLLVIIITCNFSFTFLSLKFPFNSFLFSRSFQFHSELNWSLFYLVQCTCPFQLSCFIIFFVRNFGTHSMFNWTKNVVPKNNLQRKIEKMSWKRIGSLFEWIKYSIFVPISKCQIIKNAENTISIFQMEFNCLTIQI